MTAMLRPAAIVAGLSDVVSLRIGSEDMMIRAAVIREVLDPVPITRVPDAPEFCAGLINVRGTVVPLSDLRVAFAMPREPLGPDGRILVLDLHLEGRAAVVGIMADAVHEVTQLNPSMLQDVPAVGSTWAPHLVEALVRHNGRFVLLPDLSAIFAIHLAGQAGAPATQGATSFAAGVKRI